MAKHQDLELGVSQDAGIIRVNPAEAGYEKNGHMFVGCMFAGQISMCVDDIMSPMFAVRISFLFFWGPGNSQIY